jgi:hypothetical protein
MGFSQLFEDGMSGPIVRTGTNPKFWANWDSVFGGKKSAAKSASPKAAAKKSAAKKASGKKAAKKAAGKK